MATSNPYQAYQQNNVNTASPGQLTLMLYEGCIKFIKLGKLAIQQNDIQAKNTNLLKAQKIVQELMVTLDKKYPVSENLLVMYDYLNNRLIEANIKNDIGILDEVEGYVVEFRDTWKQVIQLSRQQSHGQGGKA
ncbi:flagellar export chaperone FliS [Metabacillus iocasae]|uniref:Flagellar secretion chaperone FliS n=1 Tax=Priestia iocasae TaxID=2291674 RepID=A0ABS2QYH1_9BACI|nr:flagellar export chaperone FliS [Metabacillus iocasae]MBM7704480.1 flagellar protein FliS [Metabacillus iocasae]